MADINVLEIEQLRKEAERDLDALHRVELMLKRKRSDSVVSSAATEAPARNRHKEQKNFGVKVRVGEILSGAGNDGMRPRDIVNAIESEFSFTDRASASAGISAALSRFRKADEVSKLKTGRYVWKKR